MQGVTPPGQPSSNLPESDIKCNDSIDELQKLSDKSVDLVYIDPPFFTRKKWDDFDDRWDSMDKYISFMKPRLRELHRVLKDGGSMYLHCDHNANAYLRVLSDEIFGPGNFRNEISWKRYDPPYHSGNKYGNHVDTIFFYTKGDDYTFNKKFKKGCGNKECPYKIEPGTGRKFLTGSLFRKGNSPKSLVFKDKGKIVAPPGRRFAWSQETHDRKIEENPLAVYWTRNGNPRLKTYEDESTGKPLGNLWDDIVSRLSTSEKKDYSTQKPEKLLERVIEISSNEGDVVLDAFAGSGTTCAVAKRLGRESICIDQNPKACKIMKERLK
jgi:DNA modification methylase